MAQRKKYPPVQIGNVYTRWTVIDTADPVWNGRQWIKYWKCKCTCGTIRNVSEGILKNGSSRSCGCLKDDINRTKRSYPRMVPRSLIENNKNERKRLEAIARERRRRARGGKPIEKTYEDLTGKSFGRLTVIAQAEDRFRKRDNVRTRYWTVTCSCGSGRVFEVDENSLKTGHTRSCGCLSKERSREIGYRNLKDDIIGKQFGRLTVLERVENYYSENNRQDTQWLCQCSCGNTKICKRNMLITGKVQSCGCMRSVAESVISKLLTQNNILYKPQYIFNDLRSDKNGLLRFDFGILNDAGDLLYLIEYDGSQHFQEAKGSWEDLSSIQARDEIKNNYCVNRNISLIRLPNIPPKKINISDLDIKTSKYVYYNACKEGVA